MNERLNRLKNHLGGNGNQSNNNKPIQESQLHFPPTPLLLEISLFLIWHQVQDGVHYMTLEVNHLKENIHELQS